MGGAFRVKQALLLSDALAERADRLALFDTVADRYDQLTGRLVVVIFEVIEALVVAAFIDFDKAVGFFV